MNEIIKLLKQRRLEQGLTQAELGHKLGLPQSHLSKIEQGSTDPRLSTVADMARLLDAELLMVPRELIGPVLALINGSSPHEPMWSPDEEEDEV